VCFVVFHSSQDHLRIGTRDLDHPISCSVKNTDSWCTRKRDLQRAFSLNVLMVRALKLSFIANNNNPTGVGLALGSTIHFTRLEFIADCLRHLSLSPQEWDSSATFVGMVYSRSPTLGTTLEESSDEDGTTSGVRGSSGSLDPRGCTVVASMDPIIAMPAIENTTTLQTISIVSVQTTIPQPRMELLPDQQQAYQEEQQA
jgi:hypothetical protein